MPQALNVPSTTSDTSHHVQAASLAVLLSRLLVITSLVAQVFVAWRFWSLTWDDSAITLGFARTFAATGRIEPTPGSGIVEGYSTTLWMLLIAFVAKLVTNPQSLLAIAKLSTLFLNLANIVLIRRWLKAWTQEVAANLVAGIIGCAWMFYETINGMETPLLLFLLLVMLLLQEHRSSLYRAAYILTGFAFLLVRFEAIWLLLPFLLCEKPLRRALAPAIIWSSGFLLTCAFRLSYFGRLVPNTITAKHGIPYTGFDRREELLRHLREPWHLLLFIAPLVAIVLIFTHRQTRLSYRSSSGAANPQALRFCVLFTAFALFLSFAIGENWGPRLRSFYPAWPFLLVLILLPVTAKAVKTTTLNIATSAVVIFALVHLAMNFRDLASPSAPVYMAKTTIGELSQMSDILRKVQDASSDHNLLFAGPDVGAVMLYSKDVRLLDLGLLCDPVLSHKRYAASDSYVLQQRHPDVIEVHRMWTEFTGFAENPRFYANYQPVFVSGVRVFLSKERLAQIDPSRLRIGIFPASGQTPDLPVRQIPYVTYKAIDFEINRKFGHYYVLN